MKALLIGINSKYIHPSVALYQLRANTTYECDLIELTIKDSNDKCIEKITQFDLMEYNLVACSCYLWNIDKYLEIVPILKKLNPSLKFVFGGPEVAYDAKYFLTNFSYIDYILEGEGEESFDELCKYLDHKLAITEVSNLHYRGSDSINFTYQKHPDLTKIKLATLDILDYKNRIIYLESSRGCPYHCSYCTASLDNKVRYFPLQKVLDILYVLMENETKVVKFLDRTFNANFDYMMRILDFIDEHNKCTVFQFEVVGELVKKETIERIRNLKFKYLRFEIGIQSTNDKVNLAVCRRQNMPKLKENIYLLNQTNKVDLHIDLIAGLPYETKESFISSFDEAFLLRGKELQLGFLKFLRGTKLLDSIEEHEYTYSEKAPYEIISNKYMTHKDLEEIECVEQSLNRYYNSGICPKLFDYLIYYGEISWSNNKLCELLGENESTLEKRLKRLEQAQLILREVSKQCFNGVWKTVDRIIRLNPFHFQFNFNSFAHRIFVDYLFHKQSEPILKRYLEMPYEEFIKAFGKVKVVTP